MLRDELTRDSETLRSALDVLAQGVALWSAEGVLQYANPAVRRLCDSAALKVGRTQLSQLWHRMHDHDGGALPFADSNVAELLAFPGLSVGLLVRAGSTEPRWLNVTCAPLRFETGDRPGVVMSLIDVTDLQRRSDSMARMANYDSLTGLPNRNLLADRMTVALARNRRSGTQIAVCYLDLDGFKSVNDRLGHQAGDALLTQVAHRLLTEVRGDDTVARVGGDEFVVLMGDLSNRWDCEPILRRLLHYLSEPYRVAGNTIDGISASIGVTLFPVDDSDAETLLSHADQAMYGAKHAGKNRFRWYCTEQEGRLEAQEQTLNEFITGLRQGQLAVVYQPIVDGCVGTLVGAEALVRWRHPVLGELPPAQFLPLIDETDAAAELGDYMIQQAQKQVCSWHRTGFDVRVSVNVFARHLQQPGFAERIGGMLAASACGAAYPVQLEVSEGQAFNAVADLPGLIGQCRRYGVELVLDGFGGDVASPARLLHTPACTLKIHAGLVAGMLRSPEQRRLVRTIVSLGQAMDRAVIACGVESRQQAQALLDEGCTLMQGHHYARPMPADAFRAWAATRPIQDVLSRTGTS
ncbi:MAG: EAL domain-containing protein [Gammaproteobacteria bacterium]|nr:EAL domain-containing protein [Gammaproteobacteria bacterium]